MKKKVIWFLILLVFSACQSNTHSKVQVAASPEGEADFDPARHKMHHGWTVFTGPKRTIMGVSDETSISNGRKLFRKHCKACHGPEGKGDGPLASAFGVKPANLTALSTVAPNHYLVIQISDGRGDMPKWRNLLQSREIWDLSNYLQTLAPKK